MRRLAISLSACIIAVGSFIAVGTTAAYAANPVRQVCNTGPGSPTDQCWNNWNGNASDGNPVNYYRDGATYSNWQVQFENRVVGDNCNPCSPFATGTGLNSRYNGDPYYLFRWNDNSNYCLDGGGYNVSDDEGSAYVWSCSANANQLFVYDTCGGTCSVYIDVGPSNLASEHRSETYPVWVGCFSGSCADGTSVFLTGNPLDTQDFTLKGAA